MAQITEFKIGDSVKVIDMPVWGKVIELDKETLNVEIDNPGKAHDPFFYGLRGENKLRLSKRHWEKITEQERLLFNLKG